MSIPEAEKCAQEISPLVPLRIRAGAEGNISESVEAACRAYAVRVLRDVAGNWIARPCAVPLRPTESWRSL